MVWEFTNRASTRPEETVLATANPASAPIRLVHAAIKIAWRGVSTLVETTVAIEFAVSWKPLMYSNINATSMTTMTSSIFGFAGYSSHERPGAAKVFLLHLSDERCQPVTARKRSRRRGQA